MTTRSRIKELRKTIIKASKEIDKLMKQCKHKCLIHVGKPDTWSGWSESKTCRDCGEQFGCSTRHRDMGDVPFRKIITQS